MGANDELETLGKCATPAYDAEHGLRQLHWRACCTEVEPRRPRVPGRTVHAHHHEHRHDHRRAAQPRVHRQGCGPRDLQPAGVLASRAATACSRNSTSHLAGAIAAKAFGEGVSFGDVFSAINYNPAKPQTKKRRNRTSKSTPNGSTPRSSRSTTIARKKKANLKRTKATSTRPNSVTRGWARSHSKRSDPDLNALS